MNEPQVAAKAASNSTTPLFITGLVIALLGLGVAVLGYVGGMADSFEKIEELPVPTPRDLAEGVHSATLSLIVGLLIGGLGGLLIVLDLMRSARARNLGAAEGPWR